LLLRRFRDADDETDTNPFDGLDTEVLSTGVPLLCAARSQFDCEVSMHLDIEADYEVYMARVVASKLNTTEGGPMLRIRSTE
jgi:flavin reductase (DIM6/NTAB) family NADH-FMN oxidoreductase RutF